MLFRPFAFISLKVLLLASSGALSLPLGQFSRSLLTYDVAIRRGVDSLLITRSTPSSSATGGGKRVRIEDLVNKEEIDPISQKLKLGETTPTPQTPDPSKPSFSGYVNLKAQFISYNVDAPLYCPLSNCPQPPGTQFADAISRYSHLSFEHKKEDPILCLEGCGTMICPASMRNHVYQVCSRVDRPAIACIVDNCCKASKSKAYTNPRSLNDHIKNQEKLAPFFCPVLGCPHATGPKGMSASALINHSVESHNLFPVIQKDPLKINLKAIPEELSRFNSN